MLTAPSTTLLQENEPNLVPKDSQNNHIEITATPATGPRKNLLHMPWLVSSYDAVAVLSLLLLIMYFSLPPGGLAALDAQTLTNASHTVVTALGNYFSNSEYGRYYNLLAFLPVVFIYVAVGKQSKTVAALAQCCSVQERNQRSATFVV